MRNASALRLILAAAVLLALTACTVHPPGERAQRELNRAAGAPYRLPPDHRQLPTLSASPTPDQLVAYALLSNAHVEQTYWQWRSALEQVPQEGTQKTNVMLTYDAMINNGSTAASMNSLGLANSPMNSILLPDKLRTAAAVALQNARAAGSRFDQARFDLRNKVLAAYYDYALTAELLRLEKNNIALLQLIVSVTQSRISTGLALQQDILKADNELDLAKNELAALHAKLPAQQATLNALLNRPPDAPLHPPAALPAPRPFPGDAADILARAAQNNPQLQALAHEAAAKAQAIHRAKQQYWPDFGLNISTDLAGAGQSLMGSIMLPLLRYQAIDAAIRQAQANLHAAEALQRQASHDLAARVINDLALLHDAQRQIALYQKTLLPRAAAVVAAMQRTYAAGQTSILDLLDAQRSLVALHRMVAELKIAREKQIADLEAVCG